MAKRTRRPRFTEPGEWYFVVACTECNEVIPFAKAPSPEEDPNPKFRTISNLRCPNCQFEGTYAPVLMSRQQAPENKQSEPPDVSPPRSNKQK
jgi:hypothetical protein